MRRNANRLAPLSRSVSALCLVMLATVVLATLGSRVWSQQPHVFKAMDGYLFVEGCYVPPPYEVQRVDDQVIINGRTFDESYFASPGEPAEMKVERRRMGGRRGFSRGARFAGMNGFRSSSPTSRAMRELDELFLGGMVVLYEQKRPFVLYPNSAGQKLLAALVDRSGGDIQAPEHFSDWQSAIWNRLITEFEPGDAFAARASADLKKLAAAEQAGENATTANQLVAKISYPLTVFAMAVLVFGFGHLLSNRPFQDGHSEDSIESQKFVIKTLSIIILLSMIDLVWTMAAANAGIMRELNPLGSRFIHDPTQLVAFKLTVTGVSIGIFYALRLQQFTQVASWWCCLLLTLLTARWVVFQSMFL